jgi:hypothetical protein
MWADRTAIFLKSPQKKPNLTPDPKKKKKKKKTKISAQHVTTASDTAALRHGQRFKAPRTHHTPKTAKRGTQHEKKKKKKKKKREKRMSCPYSGARAPAHLVTRGRLDKRTSQEKRETKE